MNGLSPTDARRTRLIALGLLLLAFVAGALGGLAADRLLGAAGEETAEVEAPLDRGPPPAGAIFPRGLPLARQLDLTAEQRQRIGTILREERMKTDSVMRAVRPVLQARYDSATAAIRAVLDPEQRERFDSLSERRRERMRPPRR